MIKYYKQSGFKLEEMKTFLKGTTYDFFHKSFKKKIHELKELQKEINLKIRSVEDWNNLIVEAQMVIENKVCDVSVKYIDNCTFTFLNQNFRSEERRVGKE